jgi:hypothetical protein
VVEVRALLAEVGLDVDGAGAGPAVVAGGGASTVELVTAADDGSEVEVMALGSVVATSDGSAPEAAGTVPE